MHWCLYFIFYCPRVTTDSNNRVSFVPGASAVFGKPEDCKINKLFKTFSVNDKQTENWSQDNTSGHLVGETLLKLEKLLCTRKPQSWVGAALSSGFYINFLEFWQRGISSFLGLWSWEYMWYTPPANDRNTKLWQCFKAFSHLYICFIPTSRHDLLVCHRLERAGIAQRRAVLCREKDGTGRERGVIQSDTPELVLSLRPENSFLLLQWLLLFRGENTGVQIGLLPRWLTWPFELWSVFLAGSTE